MLEAGTTQGPFSPKTHQTCALSQPVSRILRSGLAPGLKNLDAPSNGPLSGSLAKPVPDVSMLTSAKLTLIGLSSSGFLYRSHIMPMMARATQSQLKKLKKLITEKMSLEKA